MTALSLLGSPFPSPVHAELRRLAGSLMAAERKDHTLQPTALLHEAALRLRGIEPRDPEHCRALFARAMRRVLVDHARRRRAREEAVLAAASATGGRDSYVVALDEALDRLAADEPRLARLVELRFFAGMTAAAAARALGLPLRTAAREWAVAKAWLQRAIEEAAR